MIPFIGTLRLLMSFIFLWAFFDRTVNLKFATYVKNVVLLTSGSTTSFSTHTTQNPFAEIFQSLSGSGLTDVSFISIELFMLRLRLFLKSWFT